MRKTTVKTELMKKTQINNCKWGNFATQPLRIGLKIASEIQQSTKIKDSSETRFKPKLV